MNKMPLSYLLCEGLVVLGILLSWNTASAQSWFTPRQSVVIETEDGQQLAGRVANASPDQLELSTRFGELNIPYAQILRVNGDGFDANEGIVRQQRMVLRANGTVEMIHHVKVPIESKRDDVNLLLPGDVVAVKSLNGESIPYFAQQQGSATRCQIQYPFPRKPAVLVRVMQRDQFRMEDGVAMMTYRYVPSQNLTFDLQIDLPAGMRLSNAEPKPTTQTGSRLTWRSRLMRQQAFDLSLQLTEAIP